MNINAQHVAIAIGLVALGYVLGQRAAERARVGAAKDADPYADAGAWWGYTATWGM